MKSLGYLVGLGGGLVCLVATGCLGNSGSLYAPTPTASPTRHWATRAGKQVSGPPRAPATMQLLVAALNLAARRWGPHGRCGYEVWKGAVGKQGTFYLRRSFAATDLNALFGDVAHRCAQVQADHRYERVTFEVNAHDLDRVGVSVKQRLVKAYCRRRNYACVSASDAGTDTLSHYVGDVEASAVAVPSRGLLLKLRRSPAKLRQVALALQGLLRQLKRDQRYHRPHHPGLSKQYRKQGKLVRGLGIGIFVTGLVGLGVSSTLAYPFFNTGRCGSWFAGLCRLSHFVGVSILIPALVTAALGVGLWLEGAALLRQAWVLRMQTPDPPPAATAPGTTFRLAPALRDPGEQRRRRTAAGALLPPVATPLSWTVRV